ncbi:malonate--CoA ligase ACSF3, mitochondrial [Cloeon dipterum]|uniref:malonate--CoA ligase ACSF3, mitochondrial n=1 Tax=Cloeon dipterum TaxID=197152 RepID=UPI00321F6D9A
MITIGRVLCRVGSRRQRALALRSALPSAERRVLLAFNTPTRVTNDLRAFATQAQIPPAFEYEDNKVLPAFKLASDYSDRVALHDLHGEYTYRGLLLSSNQLACEIKNKLGSNSTGLRISFLCPNNASYVIAQWATWIGGHTAVPLYHSHPIPMLQYFIEDSDSALLVTTKEFADVGEELSKLTGRPHFVMDDSLRKLAMKQKDFFPPLHLCEDMEEHQLGGGEQDLVTGQPDEYYAESDAMMVYTSGTTGKPKGVVLTHSNLFHQVSSLCKAWEISSKDVILHTLPLHHMHGIMNALLCPLSVGAKCIMMANYDTSVVWKHLLAIKVPAKDRVNVFMAVPTIYLKLLKEYDDIFGKNERMREYIKATCKKNMRLMVSGSASLPVPVFERWEEVTGHRLLERYGMSEVGMALSNPLNGERVPGHVGYPLPHVHARIAQFTPGQNEYKTLADGNSYSTRITQPGQTEVEGELLVKGPTVFRCYFNKPNATAKEFTPDGWFKTGDTASYTEGKGFKIIGRTSIDIIKTGGYKVGALDVETNLLSHPHIADCAVVGVPDITWGQKIAAVVVPKEGKEVVLSELREWAKSHMTPYSIPTLLKCVDKLPKNAMGKVNKKELVQQMFPPQKSH